MKMIKEEIPYEIIHEFGLTELLVVYAISDKYPEDNRPNRLPPKNKWIWSRDCWYKEAESNFWVYTVTSNKTYLIQLDGNLYEIKVNLEEEGSIVDGGRIKQLFVLDSVKAIKPKDQWIISRKYKKSKFLPNFEIENGIMYESNDFDKNCIDSVKTLFKEALTQIRLIEFNGRIKYKQKFKPDFQLQVFIEVKW